jgi:hypothetical protein
MKPSGRTRFWGEYTALGILTLLAAALRFYKIEEWSYFIDELRSWESTLNASFLPLSKVLRPHHGLFFWPMMNISFDTFGVRPIAFRLFPFILGVLSIPLMYFPLKKLFDTRVALLSVLMLAISPWHIYMSQMARWYTLLILLMFFALMAFYNFIESSKITYFLLYSILFYLAFATHYTGGFIPMIAGTYVLLLLAMRNFQSKNISSKTLWIMLTIHVGLALMLLPELRDFISAWTTSDQELSGSWGTDFGVKVAYHVTPSIAFIALVGLALLLKRQDRRGLFLAVYCLLPLLELTLAVIFHLNVSARYLLFTLPPILLAASHFLVYLRDQMQPNRLLIVCGLVGVTMLPALQADYLYFTSEYGYRDRLREAMQFIKERTADAGNDQVFCVPTMFNAYDTQFLCQAMARVESMSLIAQQLIAPSSPGELDLRRKIWAVTLGRVPGNPQGFWKWLADNAHLVAEFGARRGNQDQTTKVYLYAPNAMDREARKVGINPTAP